MGRGRDLTQGSLFGHLVHMSVPTMVGFFIQAFYDIVEMAEAAVMYIEYRKGLWQYKRV